jgi:hypothetical protein
MFENSNLPLLTSHNICSKIVLYLASKIDHLASCFSAATNDKLFIVGTTTATTKPIGIWLPAMTTTTPPIGTHCGICATFPAESEEFAELSAIPP